MSHNHSPLSPAIFHILLALSREELHGYGIMKQADKDSQGSVNLGPATLYTNIKRLIETGFIQESDERPDPDHDDERRKYYRITNLGRSALGTEVQRMDKAVQLGRSSLLLPPKFKSLRISK